MPRSGNAVRLAYRLLSRERRRLVACVSGIGFALTLMLLQIGFRGALLDSALELLRQLDADVLVIHKEKHPFLSRVNMPTERLYQSLSVAGVAEAAPLWIALGHWKNHDTNTLHPIRIIGFDPDRPTFLMEDLSEHLQRLKIPGSAVVDSRSRSSYGDLEPDPAQVGSEQVEIVGQVALGTDFEVDGSMLVSEETYNRIATSPENVLEIALLKLEQNADPEWVVETLSKVLPTDVRAFSKQSLIERDLDYWKTGTPISIILLVGVALGVLVGVIICYQVLYTEVLDHLPEFATLKAMGYSNRFLEGVVLCQAIALSAMAVPPALILSQAMLSLLGWMSGLATGLGPGDMILITALSLSMCGFAAILALSKIRRVEPAELF